MNEVNNINLNNKNTSQQNKLTMYDVAKYDYEQFISKMEESDFKNSYTRFLTELRILQSLKKQAQQYAEKQEIDDVEEKISTVRKILKEQFGISAK